jgi:hypothetical protein
MTSPARILNTYPLENPNNSREEEESRCTEQSETEGKKAKL